MSVNLEIVPLSTVSMQLMKSDAVSARSFVEVFTSIGSVGVYRVRAPQESYGSDVITVELEHAVTEVADYLVKDVIEETSMTAQAAMKKVFSHYKGTRWKLGSITALSGDVVFSANYTSVLEAMLSILEQQSDTMMTFDFTASPWKINVVKKDTSVTAEGRLSRNVASAQVTYDDSNLCTRVYADGLTGTSKNSYGYIDASTKSKYGIVEKIVNTSEDNTKTQVTQLAKAFLNDNKEPKVSVTIDAADLSEITGESLDKFKLGKLFRLTIPEENTVVEQHITSLAWDDVFFKPESVKVTLAQKNDTILTFLHDVNKHGGSGGASDKRNDKEKFKEYRTHFSQTDREISLTAERVDKNEKILEQAGLRLNSKGVLVYADDVKNGISAKINVQANRIDSVVSTVKGQGTSITQLQNQIKLKVDSGTYKSEIKLLKDRVSIVVDGNKNVKPAKIVAAINSAGSSVTISANKIYLDGHTIINSLNTLDGKIVNLEAGNTTATHLKATTGTFGTLNATNLKAAGWSLYLRTITINGTSYKLVGWGSGD